MQAGTDLSPDISRGPRGPGASGVPPSLLFYQGVARDGQRDTLFLGTAWACAQGWTGFAHGERLAPPRADQGMHVRDERDREEIPILLREVVLSDVVEPALPLVVQVGDPLDGGLAVRIEVGLGP